MLTARQAPFALIRAQQHTEHQAVRRRETPCKFFHEGGYIFFSCMSIEPAAQPAAATLDAKLTADAPARRDASGPSHLPGLQDQPVHSPVRRRRARRTPRDGTSATAPAQLLAHAAAASARAPADPVSPAQLLIIPDETARLPAEHAAGTFVRARSPVASRPSSDS